MSAKFHTKQNTNNPTVPIMNATKSKTAKIFKAKPKILNDNRKNRKPSDTITQIKNIVAAKLNNANIMTSSPTKSGGFLFKETAAFAESN